MYAAERRKPPSAKPTIGQPARDGEHDHDREADRVDHERARREALAGDDARQHRVRVSRGCGGSPRGRCRPGGRTGRSSGCWPCGPGRCRPRPGRTSPRRRRRRGRRPADRRSRPPRASSEVPRPGSNTAISTPDRGARAAGSSWRAHIANCEKGHPASDSSRIALQKCLPYGRSLEGTTQTAPRSGSPGGSGRLRQGGPSSDHDDDDSDRRGPGAAALVDDGRGPPRHRRRRHEHRQGLGQGTAAGSGSTATASRARPSPRTAPRPRTRSPNTTGRSRPRPAGAPVRRLLFG